MDHSPESFPEIQEWLQRMRIQSDTDRLYFHGMPKSPDQERVKAFLLALHSLSHSASYELSINGQKNNGLVDLKLSIELPQDMVFAFLASANGSFRDFTLTANTATELSIRNRTSQSTNTPDR